jgi:thiamine kinase-like enzyme
VVEPDVAALARRLIENPLPLCRALETYPQTLVHRDLNLGNLGLLREHQAQVVLLDWQYAGAAPPGVDLAAFLSEFSPWLPLLKEEVIQDYRDRLARRLGRRFAESWWQPQLDLALLGDFVRLAWAYAFHLTYNESKDQRAWYRQELAWWSAQARNATRWLRVNASNRRW